MMLPGNVLLRRIADTTKRVSAPPARSRYSTMQKSREPHRQFPTDHLESAVCCRGFPLRPGPPAPGFSLIAMWLPMKQVYAPAYSSWLSSPCNRPEVFP